MLAFYAFLLARPALHPLAAPVCKPTHLLTKRSFLRMERTVKKRCMNTVDEVMVHDSLQRAHA